MSSTVLQAPAADAPAAALAPGQTRPLLWGLGLATGMEFYTNDSMNLVLPDITGSLGASPDQGSWLLTVYSCTLFLGVPISIWMAGHYGYKRFLIGTILAFAAGAAGCGLAPNLDTMLFWRAVQGLAASGLVVWWRATIYLLLPKPQRSPSLMHVSTMLYLSSALGLVGSGYVVDHFHWRLMFLPNLVYAVGAIWLVAHCFPRLPRAGAARLVGADLPGILLLAAALGTLQILLSRGQVDGWFDSPRIHALAWISGVALLLFVLWQASPYNRTPLLSLALLRNRLMMASALLGIVTGMILSGALYALPEFLRNIDPQPHSAGRTGLIMCVYALTAAAIRPLMVPVIARLGQRKTIVGALVMLIVSMVIFARLLTTDTPDAAYLTPLVLFAFCLSPLLPAVGSGTVARIDQNQLLDGVSLYMTFRQFGAALGIALLTILIERRETLHSTRLFEHLRESGPATHQWLTHAASVVAARGSYTVAQAQHVATGLLADVGARQAAALAYADAFLFMAAVGVVALCLVPIIPPTPPAKK